ncbi:uncharacterized protein EV420DRAFT_1675421 [Desarmillaria tabescens]|uniref:Uncharacterized protein n=1 Tax=Armillaria tabescens TaxID=1929756 RepID=A0AA39N6Z3_ARMTA|nr:uncharacterized protein EV420DRAFT_1675421 [Desarmillaria tabescens]KAK0459708.1 hypothetical protein EV420DRAFT_1675421 [Desarmillaria tabescens]
MGDQNQQSSTPPPSTAMPSAITPTNLSQSNTPGQELLRPPSHSTPLRRSPRLSSPIPETPNVSRQEQLITVVGEVLQESRPVTPENEQVANDEPSSVLASRIMRAHDNPSPPPQGVDRDSSPGKSFPIFPSLDVFESPIQPLRNLFEPPSQVPLSPSSPPILTHLPSPIPMTPSPKDISQPDLISFDSFSNTPAGPSVPACSTSLLDSSPAGSLFSEGERDTIVPSPLRNVESANDNLEQEALSNSSEEQDVVNALVPTDENSTASTSTAVQKLVDDCQTPIRRPGRPRRSLLTTVLSPVKEKLPAIRSPDHNEALAKPEDKGKGKERLFPKEGNLLEKSDESTVPMTPRTRPDRRRDGSPTRRRAGNVPGISRRQLASLSPGTTNLLGQLPSVLRPSPGDANTAPSTPQPLSLPPSATLPASSDGPIRFPSPKRQAQLLSPERPQFRLPLDDPNRTSARRIPLEQAVAQGQLSSQRAAIFLNPRTNNSGSLFNIPPSDSPPRRVPLTAPESPMRASKWGGVRFGGKSPERRKQRSGSAEPTGHPGWSASTKLGPPRKLPFPISSSRPHLPSSISEEAAAADPSPSLPTTSTTDGETVNEPTSPTPLVIPQLQTSKSSLRQPSVITSKIPRKKPYARPGVASASRVMESQTVKSSRTIGLQRADPSAPASKGSTLGLGLSMPTTNLKRKRGPDPLPSPSRPVSTVVRQVLPRIKPSSPTRRSSQRTLKLQLVAERDGRLATSKSSPTEPTPASPPPQNIESVPQLLSTPAENTPSLENSALADAPTSPRVESSSESRTLVDTSPMAPPAPEPPLPGVRRTTRVRKSIHPGTDIFSRPSDAPPPRPRPRKPKAEDPMFAGMTSIALRHLTSSNTVKNQVYLAATLATEVIRKEGARPESPIMKARTVSQKEADEKGRLRRERAERRARRLNGEKEDEEENLSAAEEEEDDDDDDGWDQLDSSPVRVRRHRRGPGEEEDYETPIRRPPEKAQFAGEAYAREKKHVKWDRGLSTAIFVDEIKLQNINPPKENDVKKSCLAPTAKAIPLDTLGNLPNASSPLRDLIPENIVVQKFVYDSDLPQETEPAVVRNTRSRSKRSKS